MSIDRRDKPETGKRDMPRGETGQRPEGERENEQPGGGNPMDMPPQMPPD